MVKVEVIPDGVDVETAQDPRIVEKAEAISEDEDWADDDDSDFDLNETFTERIAALKDVIPPSYRAKVRESADGAYATVFSAAQLGGKGIWALTSSVLLLGVPLLLSVLSEQQLVEMEKGMSMGESDEVLAYGAPAESA